MDETIVITSNSINNQENEIRSSLRSAFQFANTTALALPDPLLANPQEYFTLFIKYLLYKLDELFDFQNDFQQESFDRQIASVLDKALEIIDLELIKNTLSLDEIMDKAEEKFVNESYNIIAKNFQSYL